MEIKIYIYLMWLIFKLSNFPRECDCLRPLNIILLLADDLGYGDLSLAPFNSTGIKTPEIEKLALEGLTMTKCVITWQSFFFSCAASINLSQFKTK